MSANLALALVLGILASTCMNVGKAIQKWKVRVLAEGARAFSSPHRKDLGIWTLGVALTASAAPLFSLALNHAEKPSIVSAMNGVGMVGLVLFAWLVLEERIGARELLGAGLVFLGTTVLGALENPKSLGGDFQREGFVFVFLGGVAVFGAAAFVAWRTRRFHGLSFGLLVGFLLGSAVILGKAGLVEANHDFVGQLKNPYPYLALLNAAAALILTQLAFWRSSAMVVVPTINSVMILTPVAIEYFVFLKKLMPLQYPGVAAIVAGVILLTATEKMEKLERRPETTS